MSIDPRKRVEDVIRSIRERLAKGGFPNESSVSHGAVLPILQACGWDIHNPDEVHPEYSTKDNQRVDYALLSKKPLIFIEVKHRLDPLRRDRGIEQVLDYAYKEGVPVAILTDGDTWAFYWPAASEPEYAERLAQEIQLTRMEPSEAAAVLIKYLQKSLDLSPSRLRKIVEEDFNARKLPIIWEGILREPPDKLLDLIEEIAKKDDIEVQREQVRAFLRQWLEKYKLSDTSSISPAMLSNATSTPHASGAPPLSSPPASPGYYYKGTFYSASGKSGADIYVEIISRLIQDYPHFADQFSRESVGNKRSYLFKKGEKALPEEMQKFYRETEQGWLVLINLSNSEKLRRLKQAAEIAGLPFDDERGIKVIGF
jgi:hypothetical protein